ncbi:MAG: ubiquitin-like domain-containing protein [Anaerolineae bacterium]
MSEQEQVLPKASPKLQLHLLSIIQSIWPPAGFFSLLLVVSLVLVMASSYVHSGVLVTLEVNGQVWRTKTHQRTVGAYLREIGLTLHPGDIVLPSLESPLEEQQTIIVQKALPVLIEADGQVIEHYTQSQQVVDVLRETDLHPKAYDRVMLNGTPVNLDASLPRYQWSPSRWPIVRGILHDLASMPAPSWTRIKLQRAISLSIRDGNAQTVIHTVARTVGEALLGQGIALYVGDRVRPLLGTLLTAGMHVEIHRAKPVTVQVDGRMIQTRTQAGTVAELLHETGITLLGKDYTLPYLDTEITADMVVRVVRVLEDYIVETETIPFETAWRPDNTLELDQQRVDQQGKPGIRKRRIHIVYEDGQEKERTTVDEWIERQPTTRIVSYGTKIVVREQETPDGVIRYWRKVRMLATSYNAATAGKDPDHPTYGITRLGWKARKGIVAVDPRVIALRTEVYVPGYGFATAADTGGKILGRRIDLCYDDDNLVLWYKWVDVYLLEPVPPVEKINWILPSYPSERR